MSMAKQLSQKADVKTACQVLGLARATYYRWQAPRRSAEKEVQAQPHPLALSPLERQAVFAILHGERFIDKSPGEIVPTLLDEGTYVCSERTMVRLLARENELRERRHQRIHRVHKKPELLATAPNQVWSWDITKLLGPAKWTYFYLYVILDIFSRYVVGWMLADREAAVLAESLIASCCKKQSIPDGQLTRHADRGPSMRSKPVAFLLADLGVTKTHSRPYTSNDNPYSEAQFKTLKYCPQFPGRFGGIEDARVFSRAFFQWYNNEHRHSGINRLTPASLHYGLAQNVLEKRNTILAKAFDKHPERFRHKIPTAGQLPTAAWINPPKNNTHLVEHEKN